MPPRANIGLWRDRSFATFFHRGVQASSWDPRGTVDRSRAWQYWMGSAARKRSRRRYLARCVREAYELADKLDEAMEHQREINREMVSSSP